MTGYAFPRGGLPAQTEHPDGTAVFQEAYAVLPGITHTDIVTSFLPGWERTRAWILARPLSGFAETFAQYAVEIGPEGGSAEPEPERDAQAVIFVAFGTPTLTFGGQSHTLRPGSFAFLPAGAIWSLWNRSEAPCGLHWIRKRYVPLQGQLPPEPLLCHESDVPAVSMPDADGAWATQRFFDPFDMRYDFHVNIVTFQPGGRIPFAETHVMEHGLYILQGTADYLLNRDWVKVQAGDFLWLRAFCPQACIATGNEPFRYLLYKDVNRHVSL